MKVLIVSNFYYPNVVGGAEKVAQNLAEGLAARDHEAVVVTLHSGNGSKTELLNGVRVHYMPLRNLYPMMAGNGSIVVKGLWHILDTHNPFMAETLRNILERERPDVVNTRNLAGFSSSIWRAVKNCRLPLVHTAHDYYLLCPSGTMLRNGENCVKPCFDCSAFSWARKRASQLVDVVTADSRFTLERHIRFGYFRSAEQFPIYNACEIPTLDTNRKGIRELPLRFGFLGRLHPTKGLDLLLQGFLNLPSESCELWIAGRGAPDYEAKLKEMTAGSTQIRWLGYVPPEHLLEQVDVLIVPSLWNDSAPVVVLESMAYGVPLIASSRGGIPELMGEGTGWLFEPNDPNALMQVLKTAIASRDKLEVMRANARQRARLFSTETMVNGYLKAFSQALQKIAVGI